MAVDAPDFPVLYFSGTYLGAGRVLEDLTVCSKAALTEGFFDGYFVIDAECNRFDLRRARMIGYKQPLWGFRLMHKRLIEIELDFDTGKRMSFDEVSDCVIKTVRRDHLWRSGWPDLGELEERIVRAGSVEALVELLFPTTTAH